MISQGSASQKEEIHLCDFFFPPPVLLKQSKPESWLITSCCVPLCGAESSKVLQLLKSHSFLHFYSVLTQPVLFWKSSVNTSAELFLSSALSSGTHFHFFLNNAFPKWFFPPAFTFSSSVISHSLPSAYCPSAQSAPVTVREACPPAPQASVCSTSPLPLLCAARGPVGRLMSLKPITWPPQLFQTGSLLSLLTGLSLLGWVVSTPAPKCGASAGVCSGHLILDQQSPENLCFIAINTFYCCYICKHDTFSNRI